MGAVPTLKKAPGNNASDTLNGSISAGGTSITLNDAAEFSSDGGMIVIDRGSATEEFIHYDAKTGATLTVSTSGRGLEGTADQGHASGASVDAVLTAAQWNDMLGAVVDKTTAQTLTTKTLTTPVIASLYQDAGKTKLMTVPNTASDTLTAIAATQTLTNKTLTSPALQGTVDGWISANETWAYATADDPTYTFTIAGVDLTGKYSAGMRVKLTNGGTVKYFIITKVAFSTNTTVTVYGGTDYDLADSAITLNYYSTQKAPQGFPLDPTKWTVEVLDTDNDTNDPAAATWYNFGSLSISIPIGVWRTTYKALLYGAKATSTDRDWVSITLSTANNSASDADLTTSSALGGATGTLALAVPCYCEKTLVIATKTPYYLNSMASADINTLGVYGGIEKTVIRAICAYL